MNLPNKDSHIKSVKVLLYIAALYHFFWGLTVICFPSFWFYWTSIEMINYTCIWQFIGIVELFFGLGFLIASVDIYKHWLIIFVSLLVKITTVIGFLIFYFNYEEIRIFNFILIHFIVWIIPLYYTIYKVYNYNYILDKQLILLNQEDRFGVMEMYYTNKGENLATISQNKPVLLIFLRHLGCSFCKETLNLIAKYQTDFANKNVEIVLINMSNENNCNAIFQDYNLTNISYVCDRESLLYKSFNLKRGTFFQLFGCKVWKRVIYLKFRKNINATFIDDSDIYQMPGIFLIHQNQIKHQYTYKSAADKAPFQTFLDKL